MHTLIWLPILVYTRGARGLDSRAFLQSEESPDTIQDS